MEESGDVPFEFGSRLLDEHGVSAAELHIALQVGSTGVGLSVPFQVGQLFELDCPMIIDTRKTVSDTTTFDGTGERRERGQLD